MEPESKEQRAKPAGRAKNSILFSFDNNSDEEEIEAHSRNTSRAELSSPGKLSRLQRTKVDGYMMKPSLINMASQEGCYGTAETRSGKFEEEAFSSRLSNNGSLAPLRHKDQAQPKKGKSRFQVFQYEDDYSIVVPDSCQTQSVQKDEQLGGQRRTLSQEKKKSQAVSNRFVFEDLQDISDVITVEYQKQGEMHSDTATQGLDSTTNVIYTDEQTVRISMCLSRQLGLLDTPAHLKIILNTPIPDNIVFNFEVHIWKDMLTKQYRFLLQFDDSLACLAMARKDKINVQRDVFTISTQDPEKSTRHYEGSLVSDFKRQKYTLYDHQNYENPKPDSKMLCTVVKVFNHVRPELKTEDLYAPILTEYGPATIPNSTIGRDLRKIYQNEQLKPMVKKYLTHTLPRDVAERLNEQENLRIKTNTTKNAIIKDCNLAVSFLIAKLESRIFKIRAGPGLTPLQIFSYAIVHLE